MSGNKRSRPVKRHTNIQLSAAPSHESPAFWGLGLCQVGAESEPGSHFVESCGKSHLGCDPLRIVSVLHVVSSKETGD